MAHVMHVQNNSALGLLILDTVLSSPHLHAEAHGILSVHIEIVIKEFQLTVVYLCRELQAMWEQVLWSLQADNPQGCYRVLRTDLNCQHF